MANTFQEPRLDHHSTKREESTEQVSRYPKHYTTMGLLIPLLGMAFFSSVTSVVGSSEWCYHNSSCGPTSWLKLGSCNGTQQSPVNINTKAASQNSSLTSFTFSGYSDPKKLHMIINKGLTVEVELEEGVTINGGGLDGKYKALQFHLHWGNGSSEPGSEHTLDGKHFSMEMHIVHIAEELANLTQAISQNRVAVLAFFIQITSTESNNQAWKDFSSFLPNISLSGQNLTAEFPFSIEDLIKSVDKTKYYRYTGSLTTPGCAEGVTWTIFEEAIQVPRSVVDKFASDVFTDTTRSLNIANNFRPTQELNDRIIQTSRRSSSPSPQPQPVVLMGILLATVLLCLTL